MRTVLLLVAVFAALAFAHMVPVITREDLPVLDDRIVNIVNSNPASTWTAGRNDFFDKMSVKHAKRLMGTKLGSSKNLPRSTQPFKAAPASFDSRAQWPQCTTISTIFDQARCGSCWAFGCVESFQDRLCIVTNATFNSVLSFQDLITCDNNDGGCDGGEPSSAWEYVATAGLVTSACSPYTVPTCPPASEPCLNFLPTPACHKTCQANYTAHTWAQDLHYSNKPYAVGNAAAMAQEISTHGPVEAAFTVYADFVHYKSGVYQHQSGGVLGGHAVKIIGYGTENGTAYWLVSNSWTTTWGDGGYFKIRRGVNECGIEDDVVAGIPKI